MPGGIPIDPSSMMVAASGLIATLWGIRTSLRGQKTEARQQSAANELESKAQNHDYYRDLVEDHRAEISRLQDELAESRVQATKERLEHRGEMSHLRDIIATLRDVVHSEIAKTIADDGIDGSPPALAIEHHTPPTPPEAPDA